MKQTHLPELFFLRVTDNKTKLARLTTTVQQHFVKGDRLVILVPSEAAAAFIDELLWKMPPESFLPHAMAPCSQDERIVVARDLTEVTNGATVAINLGPEALQPCAPLETIYELYDQTDSDKEQQSRRKIEAYEQMGLSVGKKQTS